MDRASDLVRVARTLAGAIGAPGIVAALSVAVDNSPVHASANEATAKALAKWHALAIHNHAKGNGVAGPIGHLARCLVVWASEREHDSVCLWPPTNCTGPTARDQLWTMRHASSLHVIVSLLILLIFFEFRI